MTPRGVYRATCLPCGNGEAEESIQLGLWQRRGVRREGAGVLRATSNSRVEDGEAVNLQTCNYIQQVYMLDVQFPIISHCELLSPFPSWTNSRYDHVISKLELLSRSLRTLPYHLLLVFNFRASIVIWQFHNFLCHGLNIFQLWSLVVPPWSLAIISTWKSHPTDHLLSSLQLNCALFFSLHHPALEAPISLLVRQRNSNPFMPHRLGQKSCWKFLEA